MSRLALGRFIWEAVSNLDTVLNYSKNSISGTDFRKNTSPIISTNIRRMLNTNFSNKHVSYTDDIHVNDQNFNNKLRSTKVHNKESPNFQKNNIDKEKEKDKESNDLHIRVKLMTNTNNSDNDNFSKNNNGSTNIIENEVINDNSKHDQHNNKHIHSEIKMLIYSGHDSTMVPLLRAFGLYNSKFAFSILILFLLFFSYFSCILVYFFLLIYSSLFFLLLTCSFTCIFYSNIRCLRS